MGGGASTADDADAPVFDPSVAAGAFDAITDAVAVLEHDGTITYANRYLAGLLGHEPGYLVGQNLADHIHPDDLARAYEVLGRVVDGSLGVALTPADYRIRHADGSWCPLELNGASIGADAAGQILVIGRYSADHDIQARILQVLTSGRPVAAAIDLVPAFGTWRHPDEHHAVVSFDSDGTPTVCGSDLAVQLATIDEPESPWDRAARTGLEQRVTVAELPPVLRDRAAAHGLEACWAVPVADPRHPYHSVVVAWTRVGGPPSAVHVYAVQVMEGALRLILQWGQQLADLEWAARHDPLTGAVNRDRFFHLLETLDPNTDATVAVLYADLDGFKAVNDAHGHAVGDEVLCEVVSRFEQVRGDDEVLARLGGDEFAVLCPALDHPDHATTMARRLIESLRAPVTVGDIVVQVGVSVGIATAPQDSVRADALIERADHALYAAKSAGRGRWEVSAEPPGPG